MKRRTFLKGLGAATGATIIGGLYTWQIEPFWLELVRIKMPIKNLPNDLIGKTLMQISDIHVGPRFDHQFIISSFKKAQAFNPDFVAYTGDYITLLKGQYQSEKLKQVMTNAVKGKLGTVGILGNHDYGKNWAQNEIAEEIVKLLEANSITVLRNSQINMQGLNFIGFDDYWGPNFNPDLVMKDYQPLLANVVLCHNPDACDADVWNDYEGWILSGHTHGGQVKPPFLPPPMLPVKNKRYTSGKIELTHNRTLYINRALGHLWQVRFNVRPEITIFELEKG